ncbi:MAG TPA: type IV pilus assembly protein PilM [Candidatus Doudnabacteria bacterium]|nr:type IV pilus assembly protein PilM [Candidatus Doudnabacteria bacterium]
MSFFRKKHHYVGLHINSHAIKALQFDVSRSHNTIRAFTNVAMPKGLIVNDEFVDHEALSQLISKSLQKPQSGNFSTNRVVVAVPESKSFVRIIPFQKIKESEIGNAILFEAESYIPLPMDQVYFDWQILGENSEGLEILVIASPKAYIDKYSLVLEGAGLKIAGIETESQSVARALVPSSVQTPILIADMDAYKTALIMVQGGNLQFTSSVPIAGNTFTERLAKALSLSLPDAEKLKHEVGFTNTVEYPNLKIQMVPALEDLAAEIKNILKFHYDHHESHIESLVLTGGGAKLKNIAEALEPMLEQYAPLKVTVANPLQYIPNFKETNLGPYEALSFTTTLGLAMWEINE